MDSTISDVNLSNDFFDWSVDSGISDVNFSDEFFNWDESQVQLFPELPDAGCTLPTPPPALPTPPPTSPPRSEVSTEPFPKFFPIPEDLPAEDNDIFAFDSTATFDPSLAPPNDNDLLLPNWDAAAQQQYSSTSADMTIPTTVSPDMMTINSTTTTTSLPFTTTTSSSSLDNNNISVSVLPTDWQQQAPLQQFSAADMAIANNLITDPFPFTTITTFPPDNNNIPVLPTWQALQFSRNMAILGNNNMMATSILPSSSLSSTSRNVSPPFVWAPLENQFFTGHGNGANKRNHTMMTATSSSSSAAPFFPPLNAGTSIQDPYSLLDDSAIASIVTTTANENGGNGSNDVTATDTNMAVNTTAAAAAAANKHNVVMTTTTAPVIDLTSPPPSSMGPPPRKKVKTAKSPSTSSNPAPAPAAPAQPKTGGGFVAFAAIETPLYSPSAGKVFGQKDRYVQGEALGRNGFNARKAEERKAAREKERRERERLAVGGSGMN